jgi:hypothetical protein
MALAFRSQRQAPHTAPLSTRKLGANDNSTRVHFQVTAPTDGAGGARERTKISVLSRFNGSPPAGDRLLASLYFMTPRSKRKASRELIPSGVPFLGSVRRRPREAGCIAKIARSRL